jgi:hypothetical protein
MDSTQGLGANASPSLMSPNNAFTNPGGPSFFNQIPQERPIILLDQTAIVASTWTDIIGIPRNPYMSIEDIWIYNLGGSAMSCWFAFPLPGSAFSSGGSTSQVDTFQICHSVALIYRETNTSIAVDPKQPVWFYCDQNCNIRLSGKQVNL